MQTHSDTLPRPLHRLAQPSVALPAIVAALGLFWLLVLGAVTGF